jgi:hypothetical protein
MTQRPLVLFVAALAACSSQSPPESKPTPAAAVAQAEQIRAIGEQSGRNVVSVTMVFRDPSGQDYEDLVIASTSWAKGSISRSLGVLDPDGAPPLLRNAILAAVQRHALRVIPLSDFTVVCQSRQATRVDAATTVCGMKHVDAVLQFTAVRIAGDSGWVGTNVTRVPRGGSSAVRTYHCVTLAKKGRVWEAKRSQVVQDEHRCPRNLG